MLTYYFLKSTFMSSCFPVSGEAIIIGRMPCVSDRSLKGQRHLSFFQGLQEASAFRQFKKILVETTTFLPRTGDLQLIVKTWSAKVTSLEP